ncbi:Uma2 family endonuclease [Bacillus sp. Marseille-P3661]|uniref:Uma2 family endonuclease n=1 Tax=Bacillus sp. Marseille-P3661 TaxID=1936234 RepID=UPI000C86691E|nr:Uma2 family endonuclease [Bacillus sp. Marseille-P3661]
MGYSLIFILRGALAIPSFSYYDYCKWDESVRVELIDGEVYDMTPSPSRRHQEILGELFTEFNTFLRDKKCKVFIAPFDVRLLSESKKDDKVFNVVQSDLTIVCDPSKLDDRGCNGSPNFILEVLSPSTTKHDRWRKYKLYEKSGVREYWIVDVHNETVEIFLLNDGGVYQLSGVYSKEDYVEVITVEGLKIELDKIFI